jgi:hypothetical protein
MRHAVVKALTRMSVAHRTVYTERCSALQAAHPSHDGLRVPSLEVRRPFPCQEAAGDSVQVSSRCYWCTLVHE